MPEPSPAGRSIVSRRAIIDVVQTAVQASYGVTGLADPSFRRRLLRWLGLARPGVRLSVEGGLSLDLYLNVAYGVPVAEVARQVDSAVRYALRRALGVEASCVSIHVDGLRYQAPPAAVPSPAQPGPPAPVQPTAPTASPAAEGTAAEAAAAEATASGSGSPEERSGDAVAVDPAGGAGSERRSGQSSR